MRLKLLLLVACVSVGLGALGCAGGPPSVNLGDRSSGTLAWNVLHYTYEDKDLDKALVYADKLLELHGDEARRLQASLSDFPSTDPPEVAYRYKVLNDVGFATLVKGVALEEKKDWAGAKDAFSMVIEEFGYAQVQDQGTWRGGAPSVARDEHGFIRLADVAELWRKNFEAGGN